MSPGALHAVIGGVITSTFLMLLVIPTFCDVLASARERLIKRLLRRSTLTRHDESEHHRHGATSGRDDAAGGSTGSPTSSEGT